MARLGSLQHPSEPKAQKPAGPTLRGGTRLQTKLTVGEANDSLEREADRVADAVVRLPDATGLAAGANRMRFDGVTRRDGPILQRACTGCRAEEEQRKIGGLLQRAPTSFAPPTDRNTGPSLPASLFQRAGTRLDPGEKSFMEAKLGHDFDEVRVHTGSEVDDAAHQLDARAFTVERNVFFASGEYAAGTSAGRRLLAHELTHVVQQSGASGASPRLLQRQTRGAGGCGPISEEDENREGAKGAGKAAHIQIQNFLLKEGVLPELPISRATKESMADEGCQPASVPLGLADLYKIGRPTSLAEIKPFGFAKRFGVPQVEHYIRRADQSTSRFHRTGLCAGDEPDQKDTGFARRVGGRSVPMTFDKMTGILPVDTPIGDFDGDKSRTLKAKLVEPGAVGYWCTGGASDTYTCGTSEEDLNAFLDRALVPAQDLIDELIDREISDRLDKLIAGLDFKSVVVAAKQVLGDKLETVLGPDIALLLRSLPKGALDDLGGFLDDVIGPTGKAIAKLLARRLKSIILNELRIQLRNALRKTMQELLLSLCVGVPVVTLALLLDRLRDELKKTARQLIPAVVAAAVATLVAQLLAELGQMLAEMVVQAASAIGRVLAVVGAILLRILAALAILLVVVGVIFLAVVTVIAALDPVPGDEVAAGLATAAAAGLIPLLIRFVRTGQTSEKQPSGKSAQLGEPSSGSMAPEDVGAADLLGTSEESVPA
jgi:Domain of unknown function (DUF4157)